MAVAIAVHRKDEILTSEIGCYRARYLDGAPLQHYTKVESFLSSGHKIESTKNKI